MAIKKKIQLIERVQLRVANLENIYAKNRAVLLELRKLSQTLNKLKNYLQHLDELNPHYNTDQIKDYIEAMNLHLDILKMELKKNDYAQLSRCTKGIRAILKIRKHNYFTFVFEWLIEFIYFI